MGTLGLVIDAQIVDEQSDLERARTAKIRKYADNPDIERAIQRETGATNIRHIPIILSWTGIWCKASASDFLTLGTITQRDLAVIITRVLIGDINAHRDFNRSTAVTFGRWHLPKRRLRAHSLGAVCRSQVQSTLKSLVYVISIKV